MSAGLSLQSLRYLNGDSVSCWGALPVEALPIDQHTSYCTIQITFSHVALHTGYDFWKEYILRFLKTPPFKNLKWIYIFLNTLGLIKSYTFSYLEMLSRKEKSAGINFLLWLNFVIQDAIYKEDVSWPRKLLVYPYHPVVMWGVQHSCG